MIVLEGVNDIALLASASQMEAAFTEVVSRLHGAGVHVLLGTITPAGTGLLNLGSLLPSIYIDSPPTPRVAVNAWIRSGASGADGIVDFDAALRGSRQRNVLTGSFDSSDHVHPTPRATARWPRRSTSGVCAASSAPRRRPRRRPACASASSHRRPGACACAAPSRCRGGQLRRDAVTARALQGGRTVLKRRLKLTAACRFDATRSIGVRGRVEVPISFAGSPTLRAARARSVFVRAR